MTWVEVDERIGKWTSKAQKRHERRCLAESILASLENLNAKLDGLNTKVEALEYNTSTAVDAQTNFNDGWNNEWDEMQQGTEYKMSQYERFTTVPAATWYIEMPNIQYVEKVIEIPKVKVIEKTTASQEDIKPIPTQMINHGVVERLFMNSDGISSEIQSSEHQDMESSSSHVDMNAMSKDRSHEEAPDCEAKSGKHLHDILEPISSAPADEPDDFQTLDELIEKVRDEVRRLREKKCYNEYEDLMMKTFQQHFAKCKRSPRTALTRQEVDRRYGDMHRSGLWQKVCNEHYDGTGDPVNKSDEFLEMMHKIHGLWKEKQTLRISLKK